MRFGTWNVAIYKSTGIDRILVELIQAGGNTLRYEIIKLTDSIWNQEELPQQWKESVIVPNYRNGDKTECGNYSGISLLPATYKILSNILVSRLTQYVDEIIGDHWCGFRHNRSTADQIFCIHQMLEKNREYNRAVCQLFMLGEAVLCIEFGTPVELNRLVEMCLNETYSKFRISYLCHDIMK
jgi:hypothetical protein